MQKTLYPPIPGCQHIGDKRFLQAGMLQYCCSVFLLDINPPLIYIIQPHKKYIFTWRKKMTFNQRTVVITGAAGKIGRALAKEFAAFGVKLFLTDIDMDKLNQFAGELSASGADVHTYFMDVTQSASISSASANILADAGHVDILVNNAGCWPKGTAIETSEEDWENIINLNLHSVFRLSRIFGIEMKKQKYGRIINLSSIAGICGLPGRCAYSVAKAAVIMLTKTMAMELAKDGITVNSVSPGLIQNDHVPSNGTWLGYTGIGDDVAKAIVFLAADESGYITGIDMPVDGGRILGPLNPVFK